MANSSNPFYIDPRQGGENIPQLLSGLGDTIGKAGEKRKALEQEQAMQAELQSAFQSGNPLKMAEMSLKYPNMKSQIDGALGIRSKMQLDDFRDSATEFLSAPDNASKRQVLVRRAERIQERGGDATQTLQSIADFDANPDAEIAEIKTLFAGRLPNEYKALFPESQEVKIGAYNPRDYTPESFASFRKSGNPAELVRYEPPKQETVADIVKKEKLELEAAERTQASEDAIFQLDNNISTIDRLLEHKGLEAAVGTSSLLPTMPGSDAADFEAELESFDAQAFLGAVQQMKGMGALSENEGKKLAAAIGAIKLSMSEEKFKESLKRIKEDFERARNKIKGRMPKKSAEQKAGGVSLDDLVSKYAD